MNNAEYAVIGCILNEPSLVKECPLTASEFQELGHIYHALQTVDHIELITVDKQLQGKHTETLLQCMGIGTTAGFNHYVKIVKQESQRKKLSLLVNEIKTDTQNGTDIQELLERSAKSIDEINEVIDDKPYIRVGDKVASVVNDLLDQNPRDRGISTYLTKLDQQVGTIEQSDFWVIAGRPSMGKTALALSMAYQQACNGHRVGFISMDMSESRLIRRLLCHERDADLSLLIRSNKNVYENQKMTDGAQRLSELSIFLADVGSLTVPDLERRVRMMVKKDKVQIIYIDYLQQIKAPAGNREQEVARASSAIKALCKDLKVPIVALAQLNRSVESRDNKRPRLSDLRDSGQIEQDAEVILFTYRDEYYNKHSKKEGIAEIIFGKTRDSGAVGNYSEVAFIKKSMRFTDL